MDEPFLLPVVYKEETLEFPAQLLTSAYSFQIQVLVHDVAVNFERDDSGDFRALAATPDDVRFQKTDATLLQAIAESLEKILLDNS